MGSELKPETTFFVEVCTDIPVKAPVGQFLVGAVAVAAILVAVG